MGLIDDLHNEAKHQQADNESIQANNQKLEEQFQSTVQAKMVMIFQFLSELCESLNLIQSNILVSYPIKDYSVMKDLKPSDYKVIVDSRKVMKNIKLSFMCSSNNRVRFDVENKIYIDRISEYLDEHHVSYVCHKNKDSRHNVTNATFNVDSMVPVSFVFTATLESSSIILNIANFNGFNNDRFVIESYEVDPQFLEDLGKYILRRDTTLFGKKITKKELDDIRLKLKKDNKKNKVKSKASIAKHPKKAHQINEVEVSGHDIVSPQSVTKSSNNKNSSKKQKKSDTDIKSKSVSTESDANEFSNLTTSYDAEIRTVDKFKLNFSLLPTAFKPASHDVLDIHTHLNHLAGLVDFPNQLIHDAATILSDINKIDVPVMDRIEVAHAIYITVYPVLVKICAPFNNEMEKPVQGVEQLSALSHCVVIAEQISITYKYAFLQFYSSNAHDYSEMRNNVVELGFRILEMIRLEQRLRAFRYEKLTGSTWLDVNQIFFSLMLHEDIDEKKVLSSEIGISYINLDDVIDLKSKNSIRDIYLSIQLFGVLDVITWPAHLFYFPDSYLAHLDSALRISDDNGQKLEPGWLITFLLNDGPPEHKRTDSMTAPGVKIDFSILHNALVTEHELLAKMIFLSAIDNSQLSPPLANLKDQDKIPVLEMVLMALKRRERHHKRHNVYGAQKLFVNFGFNESYKVLSGYAKPENNEDKSMLENIELIQQESIKLSDELSVKVSNSSNWQIINFSSGGLLISHDSVAKSNTLQVGQILSFKSNDNNNLPLLGYVGRMHRLHDHRIEISIIRMASYAESALVLDQQSLSSDTGHPVILSKDMNERWQIVLLHEYGYISGTPLKLIRSNGSILLLRLGDIWMSKRDFTVFEIRSASL
ncbi:hypothetical protein MNBD_GAMMA22-538 [hydrothermal vent metagenome]|uniref:PilZ domain-containing protein n=1 Tax=hydrothermal vent metagenome TaxID=652676 RepID=A0A3B1AGA7_9ZZZZ